MFRLGLASALAARIQAWT